MRKKLIVVATLVAILTLGSVLVFANNTNPENADNTPDYASASTKTARFNLIEDVDMDAPGAEFSMISEDGGLVIHISDNTIVEFEDYVPLGDEEDAGTTKDARQVLFGRTLAEVLDGRNLTVDYAITTRSIPPQTNPIKVTILFETAVHLPIDIDTVVADVLVFGDMPFEDVDDTQWFYTPVHWALLKGIMNGVSDTRFEPEGWMTRAMLVTVLWRYAGEPTAEITHTFEDAGDGHWYSDAIAWAYENDIVQGFNETVFGTTSGVTRGHMYTVLYRYMNQMGLNIPCDGDTEMHITAFEDDDQVDEWARDAMLFMFNNGIMFREHDFDFDARQNEYATRGEIAGAMYFFDMRTQ